MSLPRSVSLRSCRQFRVPQLPRQSASRQWQKCSRRGYASSSGGGHGSAKQSDLPWAIGAVSVTVPSVYWIISTGSDGKEKGYPGEMYHGEHSEEHEEGSEEGEGEGEGKEGEGQGEGEGASEGEQQEGGGEGEDETSAKSNEGDGEESNAENKEGDSSEGKAENQQDDSLSPQDALKKPKSEAQSKDEEGGESKDADEEKE